MKFFFPQRTLGVVATLAGLLGSPAYGTESVIIDPETPPGQGPKGAILVFSDEFNGNSLDGSKWHIGVTSENILQHGPFDCVYRRENILFRDGKMVLTTRYEPEGVAGATSDGMRRFHYSAAAVNSTGKFFFQQNTYIEMRIKVPLNDGGYSMCWSLPNFGKDSALSDPQEMMQINFFEYRAAERKRMFSSALWFNDYLLSEIPPDLGKDNFIKVGENHYIITLHRRKGSWQNNALRLAIFDWYEWYEWKDFITIGFMATPEKFDWFVVEDGAAWKSVPYMTFRGAMVHSADHVHWQRKESAEQDVWRRDVPKQLENSIILESHLRNAEWAGGPIDRTRLPGEMQIDYVRVYRLPEEPR